MGNLKNRAKRNKRKAPNWRGIIKMRNPKKGKSKIETSETTSMEVEVGSETREYNDQAANENSDTVPIDLEQDVSMSPSEFNKWIETDYDDDLWPVDKGNPTVENGNFKNQFLNEHNYSIQLLDSQKQTQSDTNENAERAELNFDSTCAFNFDEWIEVDDDYNEAQDDSSNFNEHDAQSNCTNLGECETALNQASILEYSDINEISDVHDVASNSSFHGYIEKTNFIDLYEDDCEPINVTNSENTTKNMLDRNDNPINDNPILGDNNDDSTGQEMTDNVADITVKVTGRRIVDITLLCNQIKYLNSHSDECNFNDMEITKETKMGLRTILAFRCRVCGIEQNVTSCERDMEGMNVNKAAVLGTTSTGSGFYNLEEFCAHLDIPCMSDKTFQKNNKELQGEWWQLAKDQANAALNEEIRLAKFSGDVDSKGNAQIIVITDGSWGKRSYGKGYSSLSGCAVLIGYRTKKIIYVGVKNKYCQTCANSYAMMCPPNKHSCNINYEGPSSGMETAIIIEGFRHCAKLGARFPILIADGDASVYKELRELRLYKDPILVVQKYECVNHLYKNFRKKFKAIGRNTKYVAAIRKYVTAKKGNEIASGIRIAAKHWRESNVDQCEKFSRLEKDCMNAPLHYFGQHDNCDPYFCQKVTKPESLEVINLLKTHRILEAVLSLCQDQLASNVKSLLADYNTNDAERFNGIVAKFLGGKRINYSLAGSYTGRIGMAVVQYNTECRSGSEFHMAAFGKPSTSCVDLENRRIRKLKANAIARQKKPRKKPTYDKEASQVGYGEGSQAADKTGRAFELAVEDELAKLEENRINRESILEETIGRENCDKWHEVRQNIISSFYFPRIINANSPKSYTKITFEILYNSKEFANTAERKHYKRHEEDALNAFSSIYTEYGLEKCGIFIDRDLCFFGSAPLRLYGPESIVAVRCPLNCYNQSIADAIETKSLNFWKRERGKETLSVNVKNAWYLQIQGELHVSNRKFAYFVVWLGDEKVKVEKVERDDEFWDSVMKPKLTFFFNESMLKELANPRHDRKMKLREYDSQQKTFI